MKVQAGQLDGEADDEVGDNNNASGKDVGVVKSEGSGSDEEWEDMSDEDEVGGDGESDKMKLPKVDTSSLPADLRMDEYSDDEGDEGKGIGNILVGKVCYCCVLLMYYQMCEV